MWWYERGHGKPRWKTSMIFNDAIYVQAEWGEDDNAESIGTLEINDCLCVVHDVWWCVKPIFTTYTQPQLGQGTHGYCWWDGRAPNVNIDDWGIAHGWWGRKGVECVDKLCVTKETKWGKIDALGIQVKGQRCVVTIHTSHHNIGILLWYPSMLWWWWNG